MTKLAQPMLPLALADHIIAEQRLPKGEDGKTPLPLGVERIRELIGLAITRDRERGPLDYAAIAKHVLERNKSGEVWTIIGLQNLVVVALNYAQSLGARLEKKQSISEEDYAEASRAGHEAFTSTLKDMGYLQ